jgi:hypothetical protein
MEVIPEDILVVVLVLLGRGERELSLEVKHYDWH